MTRKQSSFIKLIAMITMLIDHAGLILFPGLTVLRVIGRLCFPLLAYQIGVGYANTRSLRRYLLRLLAFAVSMQAIDPIALSLTGLQGDPWYFNIFFTLAAGLGAIYAWEKRNAVLLCGLLLLPPALEQLHITMDYGLYGIVLILAFYIAARRPLWIASAAVGVNLVFFLAQSIGALQLWSIAAALPLIKPGRLPWHIPSAAFYLFYPLHFALLYGLFLLL